jgi:hypothetical protein
MSQIIMPQVFSSIKEAWIGVLSGTVDPVPVPAGRRASCPNIDTHRAGKRGGGRSGPGVLQSPKEEEEEEEEGGGQPRLEWNVIVQLANEEDNIDSKEIDINALSEEDLCSLKTDDPFLYYSIPSIRRKSYLCDGDDDGDATMMRRVASSSSRRSSLPIDFRQNQDALYQVVPEDARRRESVVRRMSRLSTEAHPTLILGEMMLHELQELDDDDDADDCMDLSVTADDLEQMIKELKDQ